MPKIKISYQIMNELMQLNEEQKLYTLFDCINQLEQDQIDRVFGHRKPSEYWAKELYPENNKVAAIKRHRKATGFGLKESKDFIENLLIPMNGYYPH